MMYDVPLSRSCFRSAARPTAVEYSVIFANLKKFQFKIRNSIQKPSFLIVRIIFNKFPTFLDALKFLQFPLKLLLNSLNVGRHFQQCDCGLKQIQRRRLDRTPVLSGSIGTPGKI